jgi:GTPase SAR1 family protein
MKENNMGVNEHVEEYLDYYCNLSHAPNYAVLLKGEWGSGKTWFIEKFCEKLNDKKYKFLYVSLYGMTAFSEIEDAWFQQLHPILSSKGMAITGKILKGFVKGTFKIDLNSDSKEDLSTSYQIPDINFPDYLKDTDKSILIFDDLERCKIDIENILGYINYFVEHKDLKAIIIANEDELIKLTTDKIGTSYKAIKEKLIGKTFDIHTDFNSASKDFINTVDEPEIKQFLFDNISIIKGLYHETKYKNLRNLKQIIWDFERIYKVLPNRAMHKSELLKELLQTLTIFSIEVRRGSMLPRNINKLKEQYYSKLLPKPREKNKFHQPTDSHQNNTKQDEDSLQDIIDKYPMLNLYQLLPNEIWWQSFFDQGIIDVEQLRQSVLSSQYFQDENTPNWMRLWYFLELTDNEFDDLLKRVESEYIKREFSNLGEIKHITGIFLELSEIGLYYKPKQDILQNAKSYIDNVDSLKEINLVNFASSFYKERSGYNGLVFFNKESKEQDLRKGHLNRRMLKLLN